jgi:TolB-like protein
MSTERDSETPSTAAEWFVKLDSTAPDAASEEQLAQWLASSPDNESELARCTTSVALARRLGDDPALHAAFAEAAALARGGAGPRSLVSAARTRPAVVGFGVAALAAVVTLAALYSRDPANVDAGAPPPRASRAAAIVAGAPAENSTIMLPGRVVVDANSLAVLPFGSRSRGVAGDALAAELESLVVAELQRVPGVYVVSGSAVQPFASGQFSAAEVGLLLGARGIVTGTVETLDERVRVRAQLSDAATNRVVWSADYERPVDELHAIQVEVVDAVAATLVDPALRRASAESARESAPASFDEPSVNE